MPKQRHYHSHHHHGSPDHHNSHGPSPALAGAGMAVSFLAAGLVQRLLWLLPLLAALWGLIAWALLSD
ncbi:hypothetical protein [Ferrovibrio sp.]|uniref:hypothetical protein n=1 Tax=Ferrovibrio sp. TaxID=1917215 RepID=UPI003D2BC54E